MVGMTPKQVLYAVVQEVLVETYNKEIPFVVSQWLEPHFQYMSVDTKEYNFHTEAGLNKHKHKRNKDGKKNQTENTRKEEVIVIYHQLFIPKQTQYKVMYGKGGCMIKHLTEEVSKNMSQIFGHQIIVKLDIRLKDAVSRNLNSIRM